MDDLWGSQCLHFFQQKRLTSVPHHLLNTLDSQIVHQVPLVQKSGLVELILVFDIVPLLFSVSLVQDGKDCQLTDKVDLNTALLVLLS